MLNQDNTSSVIPRFSRSHRSVWWSTVSKAALIFKNTIMLHLPSILIHNKSLSTLQEEISTEWNVYTRIEIKVNHQTFPNVSKILFTRDNENVDFAVGLRRLSASGRRSTQPMLDVIQHCFFFDRGVTVMTSSFEHLGNCRESQGVLECVHRPVPVLFVFVSSQVTTPFRLTCR